MPTLEEIAKLSQVSRSTVSRVVNDDPHVSTQTRAKVMAVVRELNYQPNAMAQSLAAGRTRILGLIVPSGIATAFRDPSLQVIIQAVASTCAARNYSVMLWLVEPDYERRMLSQVLGNGMLDGVIASSIHLPEAALDALISSRLPYIVIGQPTASGSESSYVDVENRRGARELVTHLLRLGRRKVAHIAGPQDTVCARDRLQGYRDALTARSLRVDPDLVVPGDFTEETGYYATKRLLATRPDAIFAANDLTALGALRALREAGARVPDDIALAGFDDIGLAEKSDPPLTTVRQPSDRMGTVTTETLIDMIEHDDTFPRHVVLPTELVIRQSCGATMET